MATDPYAAPRARVADVPAATGEGTFIPEGQAVAAGNGWKWFTDAWELFRRQPGTWILLLIVFVAIWAVLIVIPILGNIASQLLGPVVAGGLMLGCRELAQGGELRVGHLFDGFRDHFGRLALLGLAYFLMVFFAVLVAIAVAGAGIGFGALLGMAGGGSRAALGGMMTVVLAALVGLALLIPAAMAIWFAPALVVLNGFGVVDALKASFSASLKNIVPFLVYGVIFFGLGIVATIPGFLGWLVLGPTIVASVYTAYRDVFYAS